MSIREVCFLVGKGGAILWSDVGASAALLPDSRARWEAIWKHRAFLQEIAHSHPVGPLGFSHEDETTMEALTSALGNAALRFSVVAPNGMVRREQNVDAIVKEEPWWADLLRMASGMRI